MDLSKIKSGDEVYVKLDKIDVMYTRSSKIGDVIKVIINFIEFDRKTKEWFIAVKSEKDNTIFSVNSKQILPTGKLTESLFI